MARFRATNNEEGRDDTVTVRLSSRLRFNAELAAKLQNISLSNYIETLLETDWQNVPLQPDTELEAELGPQADKPYLLRDFVQLVWDTDEAERFRKQLAYPWTLDAEQLRIKRLLDCAPSIDLVKHWEAIKRLFKTKINDDPELAVLLEGVDWQFAVMGDKERIALYKSDPEQFTERSKKHLEQVKESRCRH